jgi:hypothetical protein
LYKKCRGLKPINEPTNFIFLVSYEGELSYLQGKKEKSEVSSVFLVSQGKRKEASTCSLESGQSFTLFSGFPEYRESHSCYTTAHFPCVGVGVARAISENKENVNLNTVVVLLLCNDKILQNFMIFHSIKSSPVFVTFLCFLCLTSMCTHTELSHPW